MKKIFYSLLAVAALASCTKTEAVYMEDQAEIKIKPATALATKANVLAAIDGTEYPTAENFDVYAYWANLPAGSEFTTADGVTTYLGENGAVIGLHKQLAGCGEGKGDFRAGDLHDLHFIKPKGDDGGGVLLP